MLRPYHQAPLGADMGLDASIRSIELELALSITANPVSTITIRFDRT